MTRAMFVVALCAGAAYAGAQEKKLDRSALPAAVAATVDREAKGAVIKGYATEREHGHKVYEAETILNGRTRDLAIAEDGTLDEVEEQVLLDQLPSAVQSGLKTLAGNATITKVESLTKHGKLVAYEAATSRNGHKGEVQVGPDGQKLPHRRVVPPVACVLQSSGTAKMKRSDAP